ncbi:UDP-N-acetylmuramoyl-L-alanine--D-glutamate ligase [Qipengyuania sp. DY56-A-20]|jgi:UDP-N-acetylmuramoylalanine--D-glutamate ligase|uniref:UDP-N-acetylmuramoylalanine--D-glutamate ligase n=1 Tax=Qipengyuania benthica TaxID=3067651 RepID=A0ABT9H6G0_9SPHN|nr:UDP-N-acetylmuramoyl-L-alanine--D-glutamate ligase [Qipengyuania sp. DY56-A-20]MDP4538902.1 UDP-N-acetylmuramoyl-L-alanine--D-glutamate ligase [Qipengyuania sp. DY56-A-20]
MIVSPAWSGKKFAVLGLARSGKATVEALLAGGAHVLAWDARPEAREPFDGRAMLADPLEADLTGYDGVVVSPGVPLNTHPIAGHGAKFGVPVIGDIELFAQSRAHLPQHKVVGITGTNGKSTTTALIHHILKTAGVPTTMGGNIGLPILEQEPLPEGGVYVLELSSYQIDLTFSLDCNVAVLLNVTPDHLDRYDSFEAYAASKARLFAMQGDERVAIVDYRSEADEDVLLNAPENTFIQFIDDVNVLDRQADWPSLQGPHNLANAKAAVAVCRALELADPANAEGLRTFRGLPHRMERVEEISGVAYVNDSKGTNTAATAPALAAFGNIHWILGGLAKEPGLGECEVQLGHVKAVYTIGSAGPGFAALLESHVPVTRSETLDRAVRDAAAAAEPGDTVLLSPACASFDQFADFEARGEAFRAAVKELAA